MLKARKEIIFELRKIISKNGCVVRESPDLKSHKVVELPYNAIIVINNPPKISIESSKHRIEIIQPIKGWIYEDDIIDLDTIEYLKYGRKYEKYLNDLIEVKGEDKFLKEIDVMVDKNKKSELKIVIIPEKQQDTSIDLLEIKAYRNFDKLKHNISSKIFDLNADIYNNELKKSNVPCLLYFGASWCDPCHKTKPLLEEIVKKIEGIHLYLCDVDTNPELSEKLKVTTIPMLFFYTNGEIKSTKSISYDKIHELEKEIIKFRDTYFINNSKKSPDKKLPDKKSPKEIKKINKKLSQKK